MLSVFFTSHILAKTMGLYTYWIARLSGEKFNAEIPDSLILEKLSHESNECYKMAKFACVVLFLFLIVFLFAKSGWELVFAVFFYVTVTQFYLSQLYEKNAVWLQMSVLTKYLRELPAEAAPFPLHVTAPVNFFDEKAEAALRERLSSRLTFLKFLCGLLLLGEIVAFFVLLKLAG